MNSALKSLLLKKGKDPMDCSSGRAISLLNTDFKIYAKVLAIRLQKSISKFVHFDQTGFISRMASDNVRKLLHVIEQVKKEGIFSKHHQSLCQAGMALPLVTTQTPRIWFVFHQYG